MKMIKKICVAVAIVAGTMSSFAQFTTGGKNFTKLSSGTEYGLKSGYKGMVDLGYGIGVGDFGEGRIEFQTAHGYQFNPYLFTGVGAGISYYHESEAISVPIFADIRGSLPISDSKVSPFIDFKIGYAVADVEGFYFSPSVGLRVALNHRAGFNFSLGYELQKFDWYYYDYYYGSYEGTENCGAFAIKIGFDF